MAWTQEDRDRASRNQRDWNRHAEDCSTCSVFTDDGRILPGCVTGAGKLTLVRRDREAFTSQRKPAKRVSAPSQLTVIYTRTMEIQGADGNYRREVL